MEMSRAYDWHRSEHHGEHTCPEDDWLACMVDAMSQNCPDELCSCQEGPYHGAQPAGTRPVCERCWKFVYPEVLK